jgi:hypothetical protein
VTSKVLILGESIQFIYCFCNCGFTRPKYDRDGNERIYILGHRAKCHDHPMRGKPRSQLTRNKISEGLKGEKNIFWKGNNVKKRALHRWVRSRIPITKLCEICNKVPPRDLANITGVYNRELNNWKYLCRKCHLRFDNVYIRSWITKKLNR